jgi:hypothetical protein
VSGAGCRFGTCSVSVITSLVCAFGVSGKSGVFAALCMILNQSILF